MPTKERLAKMREKKKRDEAFVVLPDHLVGADMSLNEAAEALGIYTGGLVAFEECGEPYLHENTGRGGNEKRREDRKDAARELQHKYSEIWGKHGAAGKIVRKEKRINTEVKLSVRTVQQYIKDFPLK